MSTPISPLLSTNSQSSCRNNNSIEDAKATIRSICMQLAHQVNTFLENEATTPLLGRVQVQTRITLNVIHIALEQYSALAGAGFRGPRTEEILSARTSSSSKISSLFPHRLPSIYIMAPHSFPEVDEFVTDSATAYGLDLVRYALPMKVALTRYLEEHKAIKAILVGTRRSDPHGKLLTHFDETDNGWPSFMRVHPVIDWNYSEIWAFIRHLGIPYCKLYDQGYTSLGGITDTHPNPALKIDDTDIYKPAYELTDDDAERLGRDDHQN
ncbi:hypothetical protein EPUL_004038 [Erysiphe pulchra]|uniref:FAD synthase n=1 Tax=Erysiphe pulchra TaxID=225359 RepID=A0A2S4PQR6_9PEZI|nr:hypothetical protein EPUL_004038 [Erysiphe pulchra]